LVDYVYSRHPRYTINSEKKKLAERFVASPAVYTAGYESLSVDAFLDRLICNGIQRIIDVRHNPIARRYGFHKSTLSRLAGKVDIQYVHVPELGIQSALRQNLSTLDEYEVLFKRYERETIAGQNGAVNRVARLVRDKASTLVCMEADPQRCHRTRLAAVVADKTGLKVEDLG